MSTHTLPPHSRKGSFPAACCRCDLMHHVRTQLPYAVLVGLISIITGDLMSGFVWPDWAGLLITIVAVLAVGYLLSAPVEGDREDLVSMLLDKAGGCFRHGAVDNGDSDPGDGEKLREKDGDQVSGAV